MGEVFWLLADTDYMYEPEFAGTEEEIQLWLQKKESGGQDKDWSMYLIKIYEIEYIDTADNYMSSKGVSMCLSEERIREVFREEMSKVLNAVRDRERIPEYTKTLGLADSLILVIETLAQEEIEKAG